MKKMKRIILTATTMAMFMSAVIFSACTKSSNGNQCANVTCQNGGACINGGCSCITGYIGSYCQTPATTTIQYTNDTYTPIKITANGTNSTIPVGGSISYTGPYNTTLDYTAYTYGATSTGTQIGDEITWNSSTTFPASGTQNVNLDVSSFYFFLYIKNTNGSYQGQGLYVNYQSSNQTYDNIGIPNTGLSCSTGYYLANASCEIYLLSNPSGVHWAYYPAFPFTNNQSITMTIN